MTCPRCSGLIVFDGDEGRCINCGWRKPEGEDGDAMGQSERCKRCDQPPVPNRTLCQAHADLQKTYQQNYKQKSQQDGAIAVLGKPRVKPAPLCTTSVQPARRNVIDSVAVTPTSIDAAIELLRGDLEALERAKTILELHQA